jgi:hypothetical protein
MGQHRQSLPLLNSSYLVEPPILSDHEMQQLEKINPADFQMLDEIKSQVTIHRQTLDFESLLHMHLTRRFKKNERTTT